MSRRPTDQELVAFLDGALPEDQMLALAAMIDAQPLLARRLRQLDPLDDALGALPDPVTPPDLVDAILAQAAEARPTVPRGAWIAGIGLLGLAGALALLGSDPLGLVFDLADAAASAPALMGAVPAAVVSSLGLVLAAALFVAASGVALTLSHKDS